jgi:hypothetical protein
MKHEYPSLFHPGENVQVWTCGEPCCDGMAFHRDNGPAVIYPDGTQEWWRHGKRQTDTEAAALRGELIAQAMGKLSAPVIAPEKAVFPKKRPKPKL